MVGVGIIIGCAAETWWLNEIAPAAPGGTILNVGDSQPIVCVKN
jgi:hypothetical protein